MGINNLFILDWRVFQSFFLLAPRVSRIDFVSMTWTKKKTVPEDEQMNQ